MALSMVGCRILQDENARGPIRAVADDVPSGDSAAAVLCHHGFEHEDAARRKQIAKVRALQKLLRVIGVARFLRVRRIRKDEVKVRTGFRESAQGSEGITLGDLPSIQLRACEILLDDLAGAGVLLHEHSLLCSAAQALQPHRA
jgi:hypothetical protein